MKEHFSLSADEIEELEYVVDKKLEGEEFAKQSRAVHRFVSNSSETTTPLCVVLPNGTSVEAFPEPIDQWKITLMNACHPNVINFFFFRKWLHKVPAWIIIFLNHLILNRLKIFCLSCFLNNIDFGSGKWDAGSIPLFEIYNADKDASINFPFDIGFHADEEHPVQTVSTNLTRE